ncbi:MAG: hypothetical protein KQJ78_03230 [Deltaproteobacteria bacterium]|nr:hypothetical protein [Deltaproteobacteria bacterium]
MVGGTFLAVCLGWLMFRETGGWNWLWHDLTLLPWQASDLELVMAGDLFLLVLFYSLPLWAHALFVRFRRRGLARGEFTPVRVLRLGLASALVLVLVLGIISLASQQASSFIYFQF